MRVAGWGDAAGRSTVSLLPATIVNDLGLGIELRSRPVRSYTPIGDGGVLVSRDAAENAPLDEGLQELAGVLEPTLTQPLPRAADLRARLDPELWAALVERPIEGRFLGSAVHEPELTAEPPVVHASRPGEPLEHPRRRRRVAATVRAEVEHERAGTAQVGEGRLDEGRARMTAPGTPTRVAVVDYGAGNLVSIGQALTQVGAEVTVAHDPDGLRTADALVVPGVGAAAPAM